MDMCVVPGGDYRHLASTVAWLHRTWSTKACPHLYTVVHMDVQHSCRCTRRKHAYPHVYTRTYTHVDTHTPTHMSRHMSNRVYLVDVSQLDPPCRPSRAISALRAYRSADTEADGFVGRSGQGRPASSRALRDRDLPSTPPSSSPSSQARSV